MSCDFTRPTCRGVWRGVSIWSVVACNTDKVETSLDNQVVVSSVRRFWGSICFLPSPSSATTGSMCGSLHQRRSLVRGCDTRAQSVAVPRIIKLTLRITSSTRGHTLESALFGVASMARASQGRTTWQGTSFSTQARNHTSAPMQQELPNKWQPDTAPSLPHRWELALMPPVSHGFLLEGELELPFTIPQQRQAIHLTRSVALCTGYDWKTVNRISIKRHPLFYKAVTFLLALRDTFIGSCCAFWGSKSLIAECLLKELLVKLDQVTHIKGPCCCNVFRGVMLLRKSAICYKMWWTNVDIFCLAFKSSKK